MRTVRRILQEPLSAVVFLVILIAGMALPLWGHAVLMESKPKANSTVKGPDVAIWLRYNVRVDGHRSRLQLIAPDGSTIAVLEPKQFAPDTLESQATGLKPGPYKLQWRALASDGHMSRGELSFSVD